MINQKNTFVSLAEQLALLNKNSVEIMTKLNDVVTSRNSIVNLTLMNSDGTSSNYQYPTVGQLKNDLDIANRNIRKLSGLADSTAYVNDGTTMRRIYVDDLNREPEPIDSLNVVSRFSTINNYFFEALCNPMLAVNLDLTDKIDGRTKQVLSRRYIIKFQKNENGEYTTDGLTSKKDFETKFLNKNNISVDDLTNWYNNPKNYGVYRYYEPYDEQIFTLDYNKLQYYGIFDVLGIDNDTINKKMWYILGSLTYYDYSGNTKQLAIGDNLIINKKNSSTKWRIKEISTAKSNYRVILECIEGLEPVPVIYQALKFYSPEINNKSIKISIGYDEYDVIFIKPINTDANIIASTWSYGTCFYTNDLVLDTNDTISMTKFYVESVLDYGAILRDMVVKNIPSKYGVVPNAPILDSSNFKVVQVNKHLTDTANSTKLKELHAQKTAIKSQLEQLSDTITQKTKEISTKQFKTVADKQASQNQLNSYIADQESKTKLYTSIVNQISAENSNTTSKEVPEYHIRGFWSFPEPIVINTVGEKQIQEVVQFEIQYRRSAKGGSEPTTEGFSLNMNETIYTYSTVSGDITDQTKAYTNPDVTTQSTKVTGYYSNWTPILTGIRKRIYDKALDVCKWETENVTDANTPNINQLDILINPNEKIEIKIRSISEVGFNTSPLTSEWSDILIIDFPDDLAQTLVTSTIIQEAQTEQIYSQIESKFNSKGLTSHLQQSYNVNDLYVAHTDVNLGTSFKDASGNVIMLNVLLNNLMTKISTLEDMISGAKGNFVVKLFNNANEVLIDNGASLNVPIVCEDYAQLFGGTSRTYYNLVYSINDFYLQFENASSGSQLGLLSYRKYVPTVANDNRFYNPTYAKGSLATYVDSEDKLHIQQDNQFVWISDTSGNQQIYNSGTTSFPNGLGKVLYSKNWNIGFSSGYNNDVNIFDNINWTGITWAADADYQTDFPVTIHPYIENINDLRYTESGGLKLINPNTKFTIPLKVFFKLKGGSDTSVQFLSNTSTSPFITRKMRFFLEPENLSRAFEFEIIFKIYRNRTYNSNKK